MLHTVKSVAPTEESIPARRIVLKKHLQGFAGDFEKTGICTPLGRGEKWSVIVDSYLMKEITMLPSESRCDTEIRVSR